MRLGRGGTPDGWWQLACRPPAPALAGLVRRYTGYRESAVLPVRRREAPTGDVALILTFGPSIDVLDGARRQTLTGSFVATVGDRYATTEYLGDQYGLEIVLSPPGARRLLGVPLSELGPLVTGLGELLGPAAERLLDRLATAPDWASRFDLLDTELSARAAAGAAPPPVAERAWRLLCASGGRIGVARLATELGCSRRYLSSRFAELTGVSPKTYGRIVRCRAAMRLLSVPAADGATPPAPLADGTPPARLADGTPPGRLADVAARCGYFDEAHLARDFRLLVGVSPGRWQDEFPFFQAAAPAGDLASPA
jgi:AraC-like DNA-binding protein